MSAKADVVNRERALAYALDFIHSKTQSVEGVLDAEPVYSKNVAAYYVVNLKPQGWVLVSAQDAVEPLLGYSMTGRFDLNAVKGNIAEWLDGYSVQITDAVAAHDKSLPGWDSRSIPVMTRAASDIVDPLIKVNWDQGRPYNQFCPMDGESRSVVGCVAVGMAQAMSVARWPKRPSGMHSYVHESLGTIYVDYDQEAGYDWDKIISGADGKVWVAHLLFHCGVSVDMGYGAGGSGAFTKTVASALKKYFSYPDCVQYYSKGSTSVDEWKAAIVSELKSGRAVIYSAHDSQGGYGHCFNIDGYDGSAMFHVNWGWSGVGNGYFTIDGLRDAHMGMNYDSNHAIVIGVRPPSSAPQDIALSGTQVQSGVPVGTPVLSVSVKSEMPDAKYSIDVKGKYNVTTRKYNSVPFAYSSFENAIVTTGQLTDGKTYKILVIATNVSTNERLEKNFEITASKETGVVTLSESMPDRVEFYSVSGQKLAVDANELPAGMYIMVTERGGKKTTSKYLKR